MPFANKFCATVDFPLAGDCLGDFVVERAFVRDVHESIAGHGYAIEMTLRGPGGQQGVLRALKPLFCQKPVTFSGYGNPYQLWFGRPEVVSLGEQRYAVTATAYGARIWLAPELERFLGYLERVGLLALSPDPAARAELVEGYLAEHFREVSLRASRYRSRQRRAEGR